MNLSTPTRLGLAALSLAVLTSCAPSTELTSSWADPTLANKGFRKIVVVGATPKAAIRRLYEDTFASELQSRGVDAIASYTFGTSGQMDKDQAIAKLKEIGADGVIVTRLLDKEQYQNYYPPTYSTVAAPSAYYGGWYGYYSMGYTYESSPGYVETGNVYRIETNLYDVAGDKLAWSGLTETSVTSGDAPDKEVRPLIHALLMDMEKKHIVMPVKKS